MNDSTPPDSGETFDIRHDETAALREDASPPRADMSAPGPARHALGWEAPASAPPAWGPPPWSPAWGYPPPPPPPPPSDHFIAAPGARRHGRWVAALVAGGVAIALAAGGVGAGIGMALHGAAASTVSSSSVRGAADATAIATAIGPSVVDISDIIGGSPAAGTGIIITSGGEVLTNNHVIAGATDITAQVDGRGAAYPVKVLGYDATADVALLQIENAPSLTAAPIGSSSVLQVGDQVVALGNAYGRGGAPAVVTGTISALDQSVTASDGATSETLSGTIEARIGIVPGDSGGPLVDAAGQVVGMDTAGSSSNQLTTSAASAGTLGFAIPIESALGVAHQIQAGTSGNGVVIGGAGPLIGVDVANGAPSPTMPGGGVYVVQVVGSSPAAAAGIQAGDVIVSLDGTPISTVGDLSAALRGDRPGQTVSLGWVDASGAQHTSSITLASGPPA